MENKKIDSNKIRHSSQLTIRKGEHPKFTEIIVMLLSSNTLPYYAEFNTFVNFFETNSIKTCGVNIGADGMNFYWNREFVDSLDEKESLFLLLHEDFHLLFDHSKRSITYNKELSNVVQDMIINQIIYDEVMTHEKTMDKVSVPKHKDEFLKDKDDELRLDDSGKPIKNPYYGKNMGLFIPMEYESEPIFENLYEWMRDKQEERRNKKKNEVDKDDKDKDEKEGKKYYAVCVSTRKIDLFGIQTIDSQLLNTGDIVLVNGQDDKRENGLYICSDKKWKRLQYIEDNVKYQSFVGMKINILTGHFNGQSQWTLLKTNAKDPLNIKDGIDEQLWVKIENSDFGPYGKNGVECRSLDSILDSLEKGEVLTLDNHIDDDVPENARKSIVNDFMQRLKNRGLVSGQVERMLNKLRKSKVDYLKEIKRTISHHVFGTTKKKSITKPNRRSIEGIKGKKKYQNVINCILDTSGSMSGDFERVLSFIFQNDIHINLIQIDTVVKVVEDIKNKRDLQRVMIKGGGGTILQPSIEYISNPVNKLYKFNNVVLTDGYTDTLDFSQVKGKTLILTTGTPPTLVDPKGSVKVIKIDLEQSIRGK